MLPQNWEEGPVSVGAVSETVCGQAKHGARCLTSIDPRSEVVRRTEPSFLFLRRAGDLDRQLMRLAISIRDSGRR